MAPWQLVKNSVYGADQDTGLYYMTFVFVDGTERLFNHTDEVEVGFINPPSF